MYVEGKVVLQCRNEILEKSITEVIKIKESADHCGEHVQHKYGKNEI